MENMNFIVPFLISAWKTSALYDFDFLSAQSNFKTSNGETSEQDMHKYVNLTLFKIQQPLCWLYKDIIPSDCKHGSISLNLWFYFRMSSKISTYFHKLNTNCTDAHNISTLAARLCSPTFKCASNILKEVQHLHNFHLWNNFPPPTPVTGTKLKAFFVENPCHRAPKTPQFHHHFSVLMSDACHSMMWREWWHFDLHLKFKANFTVILMLLRATHNCSQECLIVKKKEATFLECSLDDVFFVFCGRRAIFSVAPNTHRFCISARHVLTHKTTLTVLFSILQASDVQAHYYPDFQFLEGKLIEASNIIHLFFFGLFGNVQVILIQTMRESKLQLARNKASLPEHSTWFFDGPGNLCPTINIRIGGIHLFSSFQVLTYMLFLSDTHNDSNISFKSVNTCQNLTLTEDKEMHTIRATDCKNSNQLSQVFHCVISVSTSATANLFLNVSIKTLELEGPTSDRCMYAGFVVKQNTPTPLEGFGPLTWKAVAMLNFPHSKVKFSNQWIFCNNYSSSWSSNITKPMPLVSTGKRVLLVLYSYRAYITKFSLVLQVSTTPCRGIFVEQTLQKYWFGRDVFLVTDFSSTHCQVFHFYFDPSSHKCSNTHIYKPLNQKNLVLAKLKIKFFLSWSSTQYQFQMNPITCKKCSGKTYGSLGDTIKTAFSNSLYEVERIQVHGFPAQIFQSSLIWEKNTVSIKNSTHPIWIPKKTSRLHIQSYRAYKASLSGESNKYIFGFKVK